MVTDTHSSPKLPFPLETSGLLSPDEIMQVAPLAARIMNNPVALMQLSDRVFELLASDLKLQQERHGGYRR